MHCRLRLAVGRRVGRQFGCQTLLLALKILAIWAWFPSPYRETKPLHFGDR